MKRLIPFIAVLLIPFCAISSEQSDDNIYVDLVVTASKIEQPSDQVGSSVTILEHDTLIKRGDPTVADALSRVPSITLSRAGGTGGITNIRLRGGNPGQTLVLIDGIRVADVAGIDNAFDFSTLLILDIEKIEILRGNQSALYGSDAIGGVINIVTYKRERGLSGNGFLEGGSFGTAHAGASIKGGEEKFFYGLSANHFHNDGFSRRNTGKEIDGNQITNLRGNFGVDITDNLTLTFNGGYELANFEYDDGFSSSQFSDGDKELLYGQAQITYDTFDNRLKNNAYYRFSQTDRHDNNGTGFISDFLSTTHILGYQGDVDLFDRDVLTVGIDHRYEESQSINSFSTSKSIFDIHNTAYFVNYVKDFGDNITITLGGRIDDHAQFGSNATYRSTLAYNVPMTNSKFHASVASGFKAPSLFQLFDPSFGNVNLKPEKSTGWDFGITQNFLNDHVTTDITFFKTQFDNLIDFTTAYVNLNKTTIQGIEVTTDIKATENLNFFGNYTFTDAQDSTTGLRLARRPKHLFNIGTDIQFDKFSLNILGRFVGDQLDSNTTGENDSFFTADINGTYVLTDTVDLYARIENIFDTDYQEVLTYNTSGASAFGGIRVRY